MIIKPKQNEDLVFGYSTFLKNTLFICGKNYLEICSMWIGLKLSRNVGFMFHIVGPKNTLIIHIVFVQHTNICAKRI